MNSFFAIYTPENMKKIYSWNKSNTGFFFRKSVKKFSYIEVEFDTLKFGNMPPV